MSLSVVIPAYNEEQQIGAVIDEIKSTAGAIITEILIVDDGSSDRTAAVAESHGAKVIRFARNHGYGAAIKAGIENASSEYVVTIDGDGQHEPRDIIALYKKRADADLVVGSRSSMTRSGLWRVPGKWALTVIAEFLSKQKIPDLNSGMKLARKDDLQRYVRLCPDGMSFSDILTLVYLSRGHLVNFVPINPRKRKGGRSTIGISTGFETILSIINIIMLFNPIRIFLPLALAFFTIGLAIGVPIALMGRGLSVGALLFMIVGVLTFFFGILAEQIAQIRKHMLEQS